ncbi:MAG: hypothetical protein ABIK89_17120 [Planctomycetota bacterium]
MTKSARSPQVTLPFVDGHLIDSMQGVTQKLHSPVRQDVSLEYNKPWEGPCCHAIQVIEDDDLYRMYYRGCRSEAEWAKRVVCYAQSNDGIHWTRPNLGLHEFAGSTENNILFGTEFASPGRSFTVKRLGRPLDPLSLPREQEPPGAS